MSEQPELDARPVAVVILAAGEGKRMKSSRSKLLHELAGHSMLSYAVRTATTLQPEHIVVVVGHGRDQVEAHLAEIAPHVTTAVQEQQLGTGHAVQVALDQLGDVAARWSSPTGTCRCWPPRPWRRCCWSTAPGRPRSPC